DTLYKDWHYIESHPKQCFSVKQPRTEVLWINYDLPQEEKEWNNQEKSSMPLFDALSVNWESHSM
ncbi:MAG TPA: hypothetical protein DD000_22840, partial [Cyanobacteria bacterium UBA11166]|nr:hypothetical protein [Cyanobacteria bacterium UBA11166]